MGQSACCASPVVLEEDSGMVVEQLQSHSDFPPPERHVHVSDDTAKFGGSEDQDDTSTNSGVGLCSEECSHHDAMLSSRRPSITTITTDDGSHCEAGSMLSSRRPSVTTISSDDVGSRLSSRRPSVTTVTSELASTVTFMAACAAGAKDLVQELHRQGADINFPDYDGRTPLHIVASYGHAELVEWLVEHGARLDTPDSFGLTPMAEAMRHGHAVAAHKLATLGAETANLAEPEADMWSIKASEVTTTSVLCKTMKSSVSRGTWRGLDVVVKSGIADATACQEELMHEISVLSTLRHPDIVMYLGACLDDSPSFFVTEYMHGGDLERYYQKQNARTGSPYRPPFERFLRWSSALARALAFMHDRPRPIVHRDLKPLNLLLTHAEELKLTDFGICKVMELQSEHGEAKMSGGVGTWRYMAPEVVRYEQYNESADIYSYSLIMWFMATGRQPFVKEFGRDAELVLKDYLKGNEPRPDVQATKFGSDTRSLICDCWHQTPSMRPSAHECTQRLTAIYAKGTPGILNTVKTQMAGLKQGVSGMLRQLSP